MSIMSRLCGTTSTYLCPVLNARGTSSLSDDVSIGSLCGVTSCPSEHLPWCSLSPSLSPMGYSRPTLLRLIITPASRETAKTIRVIGEHCLESIEDETCLLADCFCRCFGDQLIGSVLKERPWLAILMSHRTHCISTYVGKRHKSKNMYRIICFWVRRLGATLVRTYCVFMCTLYRDSETHGLEK